MVPWREFEITAPDIALAGRRLLEDESGRPGVAFLATVGADGRPRMHPFVPAIVSDRLWAFVIVSPKLRDLDRNGAYAIHTCLGANDESFLVSGNARRDESAQHRDLVSAHMPYDDIDERHVLYEFELDRALWTVWKTPTDPVHHHWRYS